MSEDDRGIWTAAVAIGAVAAAYFGARYVFGELGRAIVRNITFEPVGTPPHPPAAPR